MSVDDIERQQEIVFGETAECTQTLSESLLSQVEIIGTREGGFVDCWVPTELIDHEEVPVKEEWVRSLMSDMDRLAAREGGSGQVAPITLGLIEGIEKFKIIDGFHRDATLLRRGEARIYAAVKETDWDGLFDMRIFTAKDHAHVKFSRVVQWIQQVWEHSGYSNRISVEQAVLMAGQDTSGAKHGLDPEDVNGIKEWVRRKEAQWQMKAMTIHGSLFIAARVDPQLIHEAREKRRGDKLEAPTQVILRYFADLIPDDYPLQGIVIEAAKAQNLTGPKVRALCLAVQGMDGDQAQTLINGIDWDTWEPEYSDNKKRTLRRAYDPRYKGAKVLTDVTSTIDKISERAQRSIDEGEEMTSEMRIMVLEAQTAAAEAANRLSQLSAQLIQLAYKNLESETNEETLIELAERTMKENLQRHAHWGLEFKVYEDEPAPVVIIDQHGQYDLSDIAASILLILAREKPGTEYSTQSLKEKIIELGFDDSDRGWDRVINGAIQEIDRRFDKLKKRDHVVVRHGGTHNSYIFLLDK